MTKGEVIENIWLLVVIAVIIVAGFFILHTPHSLWACLLFLFANKQRKKAPASPAHASKDKTK